MDYPITISELNNRIKALETDKSCGPESIQIEMLKHSSLKLREVILKLFNLVMRGGYLPTFGTKALLH